MSTTWKSLTAGFVVGVVSTGLFALGFHTLAELTWGLSVGYIFVKREAK